MTVEAPVRPSLAKPALHTPKGGVRCWSCGAKWANEVTAPYDHDCPKCRAKNKEMTT